MVTLRFTLQDGCTRLLSSELSSTNIRKHHRVPRTIAFSLLWAFNAWAGGGGGVVIYQACECKGLHNNGRKPKNNCLCAYTFNTKLTCMRTPILNQFTRRVRHILVPSATRLRMSLTSSSGHTQKFEFFYWLTKNQCAAEIEITKLYAFQFTSGPMASWQFAGALYEKKAKQMMVTVPDRSEGIVKVST